MSKVRAWGANGRVVEFESSEALIASSERLVTWNSEPGPKQAVTDEQVIDIRNAYKRGDITQKALADKYGTSQGVISRISRGVYGGIGEHIQ